ANRNGLALRFQTHLFRFSVIGRAGLVGLARGLEPACGRNHAMPAKAGTPMAEGAMIQTKQEILPRRRDPGSVPRLKHVALIVESAVAPRRMMLTGVARYMP